MKKFTFILAFLLLLPLLSSHAQEGGYSNKNTGGGVPITTVGGLGSFTANKLALVTDGSTTTDCTVGGGSNLVLCQFNVTWAAVSAAGSASFPPAGVANSTGTAWSSSFQVGTAANDLVQLNATAQLPAVSGVNLTGLPNPSATTLGGIRSFASVAHQWINTISTSGIPSASQPGFTDISGTATEAQLPAATVFTDQNATFGAHTYDFSGATLVKARVLAALTTTVNGDFGFDSTNGNWHVWNGADSLLAPLATGFVSGDCGAPTATAGKWVIADSGSACGAGGGLPASPTGPNTTFGITETPSGGAAGITQWSAASQGINPQTGTTYTIQSNPAGTTVSDLGQIITGSNTLAQTYTMCNIGVDTGCNAGFFFGLQNINTGTITFAPHAGQTITGDTTLLPNWFLTAVVDSTTDTRSRATPTYAAFGASCGDGTHALNWSTTAGIGCQTLTGGSGGFGGTNTQTTSYTLLSSDSGKLVVMNCAAACTVTAPATQPSTTFSSYIMSTNSNATFVLGGTDTYNGTAIVPLLLPFTPVKVSADSATATNYVGPFQGLSFDGAHTVLISPASGTSTIIQSPPGDSLVVKAQNAAAELNSTNLDVELLSNSSAKHDIMGNGMLHAQTTVTFSATPAFNAGQDDTFKMTLTGNVTSSTITNLAAGEHLTFTICQDATGSHTFAFPTSPTFRGAGTIGTTASTCSTQRFWYDGTNMFALSSMVTGE